MPSVRKKAKIPLSIILPTYDEKDNIAPLIKEIYKVFGKAVEVIVTDDNSPDGTAKIVQLLINKKKYPRLKLILRTKNRGLTNSIQEGIDNASGSLIGWMDCDFSMPPLKLKELYDHVIAGKSDIAVGSRFIPGGSFKKNTKGKKESLLVIFLSRIMNYSIQFLLGMDFKDYTSGFIVAKKSVFKKIRLTGDYGEYFIDLIFRAYYQGYSFKEIPYVCLPREKGYSKTGESLPILVSKGFKYIIVAIKLLVLRFIYSIKYGFNKKTKTR